MTDPTVPAGVPLHVTCQVASSTNWPLIGIAVLIVVVVIYAARQLARGVG